MAIVKDGVKYACASCIRGHRVKKCQHSDRPLVAVLKRGRQVTQCSHCREHRTKSGSHVKCTCAIANVPNPINGCLCEVIHTCNCVPKRLWDTTVEEEGKSSPLDATETSMLDLLWDGEITGEQTSSLSPAWPSPDSVTPDTGHLENLLNHDLHDILSSRPKA
ncbi:copper fist DNA binding domain-containing protein [Gongronella butleri]|nr:copper fist DNA binding domain-containing protein [Gongronella butleri]